MITTVATTKGGAGKTTLSRLLLMATTAMGYRMAAVDADFNRTLADWITKEKFPVTVHYERDETKLNRLVRDLINTHDGVIIDTAGAASNSMLIAMALSDIVLIPLQSSLGDIVEAVKTYRLVESVESLRNRPVLARAVLISLKEKTGVGKHILTQAGNAGLPMMQARLSSRVAFQASSFESKPLKGKAADELAALMDEIAALGVLPKSRFLATQELDK